MGGPRFSGGREGNDGFAYNRLVMGRERTVTPRDGDHVADELRALLKVAT